MAVQNKKNLYIAVQEKIQQFLKIVHRSIIISYDDYKNFNLICNITKVEFP